MIVGNLKQTIDGIKNTTASIKQNENAIQNFIDAELKGEEFYEKYFRHIRNKLDSTTEKISFILELYNENLINILTDNGKIDSIIKSIAHGVVTINKQLEKSTQTQSNFSLVNEKDISLNTLALLNENISTLIFLTDMEILRDTGDFIKAKKDLKNGFSRLAAKSEKLRETLQNKESDTTEYLNRQGLCRSFQDRATMLTLSSWIWLAVLFVILIIITSAALNHLLTLPTLTDLTAENLDILIKAHILYLPIIGVGIWALWFATKKHQYYSRMADDYNYKNDISMSYYGYKNEILPTNENSVPYLNKAALKEAHILRLKLLDNVLAIITKNPVDSESKTDTSPYTEIISKLLDQVKKDK